MSTHIKLALDWTPNPLHAGFFVAQEKGLYAQAGLQVSLVSPSEDNYATTPAKKLSTGEIDFCLCPSESVISFQTSSSPSPMKACASLLSRDASAIISRTATRPTELVGDGKKYASYGARYEDAIVQTMIDRDAGSGSKAGKLEAVAPAKLGIWETVIKGECDSTWIFEPFEGVQARRAGYDFRTFQLGDYGIPYGYSPLIAYNEQHITAEKEKAYIAFLKATGHGYEFAQKNATETAQIVRKAMIHEGLRDKDTDEAFLCESQAAIADYYNVTTEGFGIMKTDVWSRFLAFLRENQLLKNREGEEAVVDASQLYTNRLLSP